MVTKIYCPKCQAGIEIEEGLLEETALCQNCGHEFVPVWDDPDAGNEGGEKIPHLAPAPRNEAGRSAPAITQDEAAMRRRSAIREKADGFEFLSGLGFIAGLLTLAVGIFMEVTGMDGGVWVAGAGGAMLTGSGWLYLVAQIVHIRANTER